MVTSWLWSLAFGAVVGLSLGLTGGGGAVFAVPLLVFGLGLSPREAVGISLAAVGVTAAFGLLLRLRRGQVEVRTGLLFAVAGMLGAPAGSWLAIRIPESVLLTLFALLMLIVASGMFWTASERRHPTPTEPETFRAWRSEEEGASLDGPACSRGPGGELRLTSPCAVLLFVVGVVVGVLSGLFGVGGGFIIVPALVFFSRMPLQRAVGTSLLVITCVSLSGVISILAHGQGVDYEILGWFVVGGIAGLLGGTRLGEHLSDASFRRAFAVAIVVVAIFVITHTILSAGGP